MVVSLALSIHQNSIMTGTVAVAAATAVLLTRRSCTLMRCIVLQTSHFQCGTNTAIRQDVNATTQPRRACQVLGSIGRGRDPEIEASLEGLYLSKKSRALWNAATLLQQRSERAVVDSCVLYLWLRCNDARLAADRRILRNASYLYTLNV